MEITKFKETLLEFLRDVTNVPTITAIENISHPKAPEGFMVVTPFLLIKEQETEKDYWITVHFYTEKYRYHIVAVLHDDPNHEPYLGCQASLRTPRPGENWTRGHDLPDGKFSKETWQRIKNAIIRNEMVRISDYLVKGHHYIADESDEKVET